MLGSSDGCVEQPTGYAHKLIEREPFREAAGLFDGLVTLDPAAAYFHPGLGTGNVFSDGAII